MENIVARKKSSALIIAACLAWASSAEAGVIIERMTIDTPVSVYTPNSQFNGFRVVGSADTYFLGNGSSWDSGAGGSTIFGGDLASFQRDGQRIRYTLDFQPGDFVYRQVDFNAGDHSAQGEFIAANPIVLEAEYGANLATSSGYFCLFSNEITSYGEPRFNFYGANVGDFIPYEMTYRLRSGVVWNEQTFSSRFLHSIEGTIDFSSSFAVPEPASASLIMFAMICFPPRSKSRGWRKKQRN